MRRTLLPLVAAVLTAVLAVGTLAPAASAAADRKRGGGKSTSQVDRRLSTEQRQVVSLVTSKNRALARVVGDVTRNGLAVGQAEVLANVAADRAALDQLKAAALAATSVAELRAVGTQVRAVRPEVYAVVVNGLRQAGRVQSLVPANAAVIADLAAQVDGKEAEGYDVTEVRILLADAGVAHDEALVLAGSIIDQGVQLTATSDAAAREAFSADVAAAGERLGTVDALVALAGEALAAMIPVAVEPVV